MPEIRSQKDAQIAFVVDGSRVVLAVRPEDLSWSEPYRLATHQTLGGAWVDYFGQNIQTITLSGNTGWRGGEDGDGAARFDNLQMLFEDWRGKCERERRYVQMMFVDDLNGRTVSVIPVSFVLKRNKSRPLLMMYQIVMHVVDPNAQLESGAWNSESDDGGEFNPVGNLTTTVNTHIEITRFGEPYGQAISIDPGTALLENNIFGGSGLTGGAVSGLLAGTLPSSLTSSVSSLGQGVFGAASGTFGTMGESFSTSFNLGHGLGSLPSVINNHGIGGSSMNRILFGGGLAAWHGGELPLYRACGLVGGAESGASVLFRAVDHFMGSPVARAVHALSNSTRGLIALATATAFHGNTTMGLAQTLDALPWTPGRDSVLRGGGLNPITAAAARASSLSTSMAFGHLLGHVNAPNTWLRGLLMRAGTIYRTVNSPLSRMSRAQIVFSDLAQYSTAATNTNPFAGPGTVRTSWMRIDPSAVAATNRLTRSDPIRNPMPLDELADVCNTVALGTAILSTRWG